MIEERSSSSEVLVSDGAGNKKSSLHIYEN